MLVRSISLFLLFLLKYCVGQDCSSLKDIALCSVAINKGIDGGECLWVPVYNGSLGQCVSRSSIVTCGDLSSKLPTPMDGQYACENGYGTPGVSETINKSSTAWNNVSYDSYPDQTDPLAVVEVSIRRIEISAGSTTAVHLHPMPSLLYVQSGELTVVELNGDVELNEIHISAGQALPELVNTPHLMRTGDASPATVLSYHAGVVGLDPSEPEEFAGGNVTITTLFRNTTAWDGALYGKYPAGAPELTLLKTTIKNGTNLPWHIHPMPNFVLVTQGTLTVVKTDTTEKKVLETGDILAEIVNSPHYGFPSGSDGEDVVLVVFYTGVIALPVSEPYGAAAIDLSTITTGTGACAWVASPSSTGTGSSSGACVDKPAPSSPPAPAAEEIGKIPAAAIVVIVLLVVALVCVCVVVGVICWKGIKNEKEKEKESVPLLGGGGGGGGRKVPV